jgi:hypothetical protein
MSKIFIPNNLTREQLDAFRSIESELNKLSSNVVTGDGAPTVVSNLQDGAFYYDYTNLNLYVFRESDNSWKDSTSTIASNIYVSGTTELNGAKVKAGTISADKITIAENIAFTGSTSGLIFGKTSLADTTAGSFYGKSLDSAGNAISGFNISSATSGIYADSSGIMALNNVKLYTGSAGTALELISPGTYATSISSSTTVISVTIVGGGAGAQNTMVPNINNTGLRVGSSGTSSWIEFYSGPVVSGSVTGNLLNISGTSRFEAAGGVRASFAFGSAGVSGPNGAASSQSGSAGAGQGVQNSQSALPDAGNGSKGGGGGGGGGNSYWNQIGMRAAGSVAPAGATISQQFTVPTGTQSVKSFVGTGGAGAAGGIIPYIYLQGPEQNVVTGYASSVGGGNGGNGYISIADPNSGGIEVDLVALVNRVTALEAYH